MKAEITATNFRKHMFEVMERAVHGETVEISWKGSKLRLWSPQGSKLARAVRRKALLVPPESIVESDAELMAELGEKWARDDREP